jgi:hypothetical protein
MTTLSDFGVVSLDLTTEGDTGVKLVLIKECTYWEDVIEILEINKKTHPDDRIWIRNNDGRFRVMREEP